jgi:DNA polymerase-3 subunit delta
MLGTRIAVVVHDAHRLAPAHKAKLPEAVAGVADPALLLFVGPDEPDRRTRFYKWFFDQAQAVACEPLTAKQAEAFAQRRCEETGKRISGPALARLLGYSGNDAGTIARETEKLALFVGARSEIEAPDVDTVAGQSVDISPEALVDLILQRQKPKALRAARRLMVAGMDPVALTGRLAMQFFDLRRASLSDVRHPGQLAGQLRLPMTRARQLTEWLRLTDADAIDRALAHLADAEALARSGRADVPAVVDGLILSLCATRPADGGLRRNG